MRLARGVRDRHARPRTRHVAGDCASSSPGIFTAPHARKPATRRRGPTPGCGSVLGRTRAVSACARRATRLPEPGSVKGACPAPRRTSVQAQPHRLRSKRDATRRPGAAGGCGAAVLGQRVRGRPAPKGMQELNQLHTCPGLRRNPWRWYEPCWTGGRPARRPHGVKGARLSSRRGLRVAHGRWDGTTDHRRQKAARGSALLGSF